mmetsp:Transcript_5458/g.14264  ORF Transcript_5458/g.14264 Transcript_5458/m.14264 type:complete len:494 (-) Transcript_5458:309-1790(-)
MRAHRCYSCFDLVAIGAHEAGHALGFAHPDEYEGLLRMKTVFAPATDAQPSCGRAALKVLLGGPSLDILTEELSTSSGLWDFSSVFDGEPDVAASTASAGPTRSRSLMHSIALQRGHARCVSDDDLAGLMFLYPPVCGDCEDALLSTFSGEPPEGVPNATVLEDEDEAEAAAHKTAYAIAQRRDHSKACDAKGAAASSIPPPTVGLVNLLVVLLLVVLFAFLIALFKSAAATVRARALVSALGRALGGLDTVYEWAVQRRARRRQGVTVDRLDSLLAERSLGRLGYPPGYRQSHAHAARNLTLRDSVPEPAAPADYLSAALRAGVQRAASLVVSRASLQKRQRARWTQAYEDVACGTGAAGTTYGASSSASRRPWLPARLSLAPTSMLISSSHENTAIADQAIAALVAARAPAVEVLWRARDQRLEAGGTRSKAGVQRSVGSSEQPGMFAWLARTMGADRPGWQSESSSSSGGEASEELRRPGLPTRHLPVGP